MTNKRTPGPWQWTSDGHPIDIATFQSPGFYNNPELRGPKGESIITCDEYKVHDKIEDARLIAAAPDLLVCSVLLQVNAGIPGTR